MENYNRFYNFHQCFQNTMLEMQARSLDLENNCFWVGTHKKLTKSAMSLSNYQIDVTKNKCKKTILKVA